MTTATATNPRSSSQAAPAQTVTLWRIEFCFNNGGAWESVWGASREEVISEYQDVRATYRAPRKTDEQINAGDDEQDGTWGQWYAPKEVKVDTSLQGLLHFANEYAGQHE